MAEAAAAPAPAPIVIPSADSGNHPSDLIVKGLYWAVSTVQGVIASSMANPLQFLQQFLVVAALCTIIILSWFYRRRVALFLTGDAQIHFDPLDFMTGALHVICGNGEACRLCCWGFNPFKKCGQGVGLVSKTVKVSNLIVGDIPVNMPSNFYLAIEVKTDPQMCTSVVEQKSPTVVHFPETFILRLREHVLETNVKITLKSQRTLGHDDWCEAVFEPDDIMDFAAEKKTKRFEMALCPGVLPKRTIDNRKEDAPWLAVKFSFLDDECIEAKMEDAPSSEFFATIRSTTSPVSEVFTDEDLKGYPLHDFKSVHQLLTTDGNLSREGLNEKKDSQARQHRCKNLLINFLSSFILSTSVVTLIGYSLTRAYLVNCMEGYAQMGMTTWAHDPASRDTPLPLDLELLQVVDNCTHYQSMWASFAKRIEEEEYLRESGFSTMSSHAAEPDGNETAPPKENSLEVKVRQCIPNMTLAIEICANPPQGQRPKFMRRRLAKIFGHGFADTVTVPCTKQVCDVANSELFKEDAVIVGSLIFIILFFSCGQLYYTVWKKFCGGRKKTNGSYRGLDEAEALSTGPPGQDEWNWKAQAAVKVMEYGEGGSSAGFGRGCGCTLQ